jgi:hypothetical protein
MMTSRFSFFAAFSSSVSGSPMVKARLSPSGAQAKLPTPFSASVAWAASPPSTGMAHTWFLPERPEVKARKRPSGEKAGLEAEYSPRVYCRGCPPADGTTQIWLRYSDFSPSMTGSRTT